MSTSFFKKIVDLFYLSDENKEIVLRHVEQYFNNQDDGYKYEFLFAIRDDDIKKRLKAHSLEDSKRYLTDFADYLENRHWEDNADLIDTIERKLDFLNEMERFYKLFHSKGINIDYPTLFSIFDEYFTAEEKQMWEQMFGNEIEFLSKKGKRPSENEIIDAILTKSLDDPNLDFEYIPEDIILYFLDKYGYSLSKNKIKSIWKKRMDEKRYDRFKKNFR